MQKIRDYLFSQTHSDIDEVNFPVRAEQIRARLSNYPLMVGGQVLLAPLLCALMWPVVDHGVLLSWLSLVYIAHLAEISYWAVYRKASGTIAECKRWRTRFILFVAILGTLWGSIGVLMFVPGDLAYQAMLICVILGLAAGAVTVNPVFPPALYIYATLLILPVIGSCLLVGDYPHLILAVMLAVYLAFVLNAGRELAGTFELSLHRGLENAKLVEQLTEEKHRAEQAQLSAEQANRMKSKFFAAASHDLRQPVHALTLFVDVLKNREHDAQTTQLVGQVEQSVEVLGSMFDALLDISRLDAGVVQPRYERFPIQPLLDRMYAEFSWLALDKGLRFEMANSSVAVYSDSLLLERILRNLIANAIRYTERGEVVVSCRLADDGLQLEVRDTGIGITPEHLPHIFEEYYQVGNRQRDRSNGLGLGLAIVRRLEQLLGYRMTLDSTPGAGSRFAFVVPLADATASPDAMIRPVESA
ncbi:MAG TPA: HAMP domain-containing sensor histidine kinase [Gallionella sp.]|nr:HAMP domain-containing sensor histidine kinase [Gallionella sp.]